MDRAAEAEFSEFMHGRWLQLVRLGYVLTGDRGLAEDLAHADSMTSPPGPASTAGWNPARDCTK